MNRSIPTILLGTALATSACGGGPPPPAPTPRPEAVEQPSGGRPAPISLATGYQATAVLERSDSITLTLPGGERQVQQMGRHARFAIDVRRDGSVRIRLDSLALRPSVEGSERAVVGTVWQGRLTNQGLEDLRTASKAPLAADLGERVERLFPHIPGSGVLPGERWSDTSDATRQVEIFETQEHRVRQWEAGERSPRRGIVVQPVRLHERFEQLGDGEQAGRKMRMSAQGSSNSTYYMLVTGRLDAITTTDSAARLITIPSTRQAIPTIQVTRTTVMFEYR